MITVVNCETLAVSEYSLSWAGLAAYNDVLYGLDAGLVKLTTGGTEVVEPTITTGKLQFGRGAKLRKVSLGSVGESTVQHTLDGKVFPTTTRNNSSYDADHATNMAYEGSWHQFVITFSGELRYVDLSVVGTRGTRGQNDG
jgi:hypothetical protein